MENRWAIYFGCCQVLAVVSYRLADCAVHTHIGGHERSFIEPLKLFNSGIASGYVTRLLVCNVNYAMESSNPKDSCFMEVKPLKKTYICHLTGAVFGVIYQN